jgi:hypothetical protein
MTQLATTFSDHKLSFGGGESIIGRQEGPTSDPLDLDLVGMKMAQVTKVPMTLLVASASATTHGAITIRAEITLGVAQFRTDRLLSSHLSSMYDRRTLTSERHRT